jgi:protein TonB
MQTSPIYPEVALRTRASGSIVLELQIDDQGKVIKATPVSGPAIFHNAAVSAALKWRYKPASIRGVNVSSQSRVTMAFNLKK